MSQRFERYNIYYGAITPTFPSLALLVSESLDVIALRFYAIPHFCALHIFTYVDCLLIT